MRFPGTRIIAAAACTALLASAWQREARAADAAQLTDHQKVVHVLNRLAFGPRPGDVERVEAMGLEAYIHQQLHPESIEDAKADKALAGLDTLQMSSSHLMDGYYDDIRRFLQQQMAEGNAQDMKMRYGIDASRYNKGGPATKPAPPTPQDLAQRDALRCIGELQKGKIVRAVLSERQLDEVLVDFWSNHFNIDIRKNACRALKTADDRDAIRPHVLGKFRDLLGASAHSPAMLAYLDNNENAAVRQRGKFETFVAETFVSYKFGMNARGMIPATEGPNENYGREILELHTLGVDGGYTQKDVQEVARCFTGWTFNFLTGNFNFESNRHDRGEKLVLGHVIPAGGGIEDGQKVLDILASHPATSHFIARKLCQRFVSDDPPAELVERVAGVFRDTDGDLRRVVEAIVTSDEFFSPAAFRAKIKSPFEYAVSAVRATSGTFVDPPTPLMRKLKGTIEGVGTMGYEGNKLSADKHKSVNWWIHDMGEPLFAFTAPTGYPERSSRWVNPGALIERLNFALALTQENVGDVRIDPGKLVGEVDTDQPQRVLDRLAESIVHGPLSDSTRKSLVHNALPTGEGKTVDVPKLTALILGSPEFQRR
ncbi:MAG TPA: DUF1800 domain-containing protein [Tepidisphaeraceae bacterium]|nr:DUF1800 domain-containing protein [Tepidisphaeraceae bacterium]